MFCTIFVAFISQLYVEEGMELPTPGGEKAQFGAVPCTHGHEQSAISLKMEQIISLDA